MDPRPSRRAAALVFVGILVLAAGTAAASRGRPASQARHVALRFAADDQTAYDVRVRNARDRGAGRPGSRVVQRDPVRGGVRRVARREGFLTGPSRAAPPSLVMDYVRRRPDVFGLDSGDLASMEPTRRYTSESGTTHLQWQQTFEGIPAFDQGLRANVSVDGRLLNVSGAPRPDLSVPSIEPLLGPADALRALARDLSARVTLGRPGPSRRPERTTRFGAGHRATLVLFGDAHGERLAWRVLLRADSQHVYDAVVDATTGKTLYRQNLVRHGAGLAFDNHPGAPAGGIQQSRSFPETGEDPWLTSASRLLGDNAHVYSDEDDDPPDAPGAAPGDEISPSASRTWEYPHEARPASSGQRCPAVPGCSWNDFDSSFSWRVNRAQAGTQLFYFVNRFHDHLRDAPGIGFDDSSGNFERPDRVEGQVDDGATTDSGVFDDFPDCDHTNNASVITLPDGDPLLMQLYLWSSACAPGSGINDVNAADDAMVVYHEYTHGMTSRLVTDAAGFGTLDGPQSGAIDEGAADWYALDFLNALGFEPDSPAPGELRTGTYLGVELRSQAFDCPVGTAASACGGSRGAGSGGYTYGDFGKILGFPEVHADGEIWVETLWDLRAALMGAHGAAGGIERARALVTDGLRLSPAHPTFLDMRDAILQADLDRGFGDRDRIWAVFAARGMGLRAATSGDADTSPVEDFSVPGAAPPPPPPPTDETDPVISEFALAHRRFRVGFASTPVATRRRRAPVGSAFRFRLSEPATVAIAIARSLPGRRVGRACRRPTRHLRLRPRCRRYRMRGTLMRPDLAAGMTRVHFSGRIGRRALKAGRYRATISAADGAGNRSQRRRASFTIVPR